MKHFFWSLLLITLLPFRLWAQQTQLSAPKSTWKCYGVSAGSGDICFITVKIRPAESGKNHNWEHYYVNQNVNYGYRISQLIGLTKSARWSFESGLVFTKKIMNVDFENVVPEVSVKNVATTPVYYKTIYHCLDIPFRVVFAEGQKKLKFLCSFGLNKTFSLRLNREAITFSGNEIIHNQKNIETKQVKRIFSSSDWGAGIRYDFSKRTQIRLITSIQRSYASTRIDNKKILFWNSGICFGYCYFIR